ncbi:unnamed protein product [Ostreobium quekettii]|uniref:Uncharacterized protein n=1 Tax=Ostreobium quekettii TaxID=121088 RepID=A0A8S1JAE2_9CHLO|nr:unnamed protein product [Ostreobium quekettii]|eukprot:evm.model.scf_422.4 EVM.evm.TU.scf_422.4   scf_422:14758-20840(-)
MWDQFKSISKTLQEQATQAVKDAGLDVQLDNVGQQMAGRFDQLASSVLSIQPEAGQEQQPKDTHVIEDPALLRQRLKAVEEAAADALGELEDLKDQLSQSEQSRAAAEIDAQKAGHEVRKLRKQLLAEQESLSTRTCEFEALKDQLAKARRAPQSSQEEPGKVASVNRDLISKCEKAEEGGRMLKVQLETKSAEVEQLRSRLATLQGKASQLEANKENQEQSTRTDEIELGLVERKLKGTLELAGQKATVLEECALLLGTVEEQVAMINPFAQEVERRCGEQGAGALALGAKLNAASCRDGGSADTADGLRCAAEKLQGMLSTGACNSQSLAGLLEYLQGLARLAEERGRGVQSQVSPLPLSGLLPCSTDLQPSAPSSLTECSTLEYSTDGPQRPHAVENPLFACTPRRHSDSSMDRRAPFLPVTGLAGVTRASLPDQLKSARSDFLRVSDRVCHFQKLADQVLQEDGLDPEEREAILAQKLDVKQFVESVFAGRGLDTVRKATIDDTSAADISLSPAAEELSILKPRDLVGKDAKSVDLVRAHAEQLKEELAQVEARHAECCHREQAALGSNDSLRQEVVTLRTELADSRNARQLLANDLKTCQSELEELLQGRHRLEGELASINTRETEMQEMKTDLLEARKKVSAVESELLESAVSGRKGVGSIRGYEEEVQGLRAQIAGLESKLQSAEEALQTEKVSSRKMAEKWATEFDERVSDANSHLRQETAKREAALQDQLDHAQGRTTELEARVNELEDAASIAEEFRTRNEGLQTELAAANDELQAAAVEHKELQEELASRVAMVEDRKKKFLVVQGAFKKREEELKAKIAEMDLEIGNLCVKLDATEQQASADASELILLKRQHTELIDVVARLEEQCHKLESEASERRQAAIDSEAKLCAERDAMASANETFTRELDALRVTQSQLRGDSELAQSQARAAQGELATAQEALAAARQELQEARLRVQTAEASAEQADQRATAAELAKIELSLALAAADNRAAAENAASAASTSREEEMLGDAPTVREHEVEDLCDMKHQLSDAAQKVEQLEWQVKMMSEGGRSELGRGNIAADWLLGCVTNKRK